MSHYIITVILLLIITIGWLIWRFYSSRHTVPCPAWLSWMVELDNPFAKAHKAREIINALPMNKGMKVLDVGCGPGRVLLPLARKIADIDGRVTGLDIQAEMLNKTFAKAKKLNVNNIDFIFGNIDQVPINQNYDVILMVCVLGEIPRGTQESAMRKVATYLQPAGIISITETIFDPHFQKHQAVVQLMERIGFKEIKFIGSWFAYTVQFKANKLLE